MTGNPWCHTILWIKNGTHGTLKQSLHILSSSFPFFPLLSSSFSFLPYFFLPPPLLPLPLLPLGLTSLSSLVTLCLLFLPWVGCLTRMVIEEPLYCFVKMVDKTTTEGGSPTKPFILSPDIIVKLKSNEPTNQLTDHSDWKNPVNFTWKRKK